LVYIFTLKKACFPAKSREKGPKDHECEENILFPRPSGDSEELKEEYNKVRQGKAR